MRKDVNQEKTDSRELSLCTDWINSDPIFYNEKTREVSRNLLDVVDWRNFAFDPEGLYNYLFFGYQVFEQTPVKNVKMLRFSSRLIRAVDGEGRESLQIHEDPDPIDAFSGRKSSAEEAIEKLQNHIGAFEHRLKKEDPRRFILPLSGGFDSRFLAAMIEDKSRIDAFTYDISLSGNSSFELLKAKEICRRLGIRWQQVFLDRFWEKSYLHRNFRAFSLEMPIHACYHMEMYDFIEHNYGKNNIVLSGSVGDWWRTHKANFNVPKDHLNFDALFFNHGISIPREFIKVHTNHEIKRDRFEKNIHRLKDDEIFRLIFARRGRMGLATYIFRTAKQYFDTYTPFYDIDVAMAQLNLPSSQKSSQKWVYDYFRKTGLSLEEFGNTENFMSYDCSLDIQVAHSLSSSDFLHQNLLGAFIDEKRITWINQELSRIRRLPCQQLRRLSQFFFSLDNDFGNIFRRSIFGRGFDLFYLKFFRTPVSMKAISEWTVLKPIEIMMQIAQRNGDMSWLISKPRVENDV